MTRNSRRGFAYDGWKRCFYGSADGWDLVESLPDA